MWKMLDKFQFNTKFQQKSRTPLFSLQPEQSCCRFSLAEIQLATHNFDRALVIWEGGIGRVYKGFIDNGATTVAIKRLDPRCRQGAREFEMEVEMLSKVRHTNIVPLIGYCSKQGEMIIVYEYMAHGSLADYLYILFVHIASQCLHSRPKNRPTMGNVVVSLTLALSLQERTGSFRLHRNIFNAASSSDEEEQAVSSTEQLVVINSGNSGHRDGENLNIPLSLQSEQLCRQFSFADIKSATNNFDNTLVIGKGGFGNVYKGFINNGAITVAIKRLNPVSKQGAPEFWTEIAILSKIRHSHIITLIGYCHNREEMILVYEYMVHGTLADHIHKTSRNSNNDTLSWLQRLKICIGAAHGLNHLHTGTDVEQRVIHRDVKSSNILLNGIWAAKISDFGLSKIGPANQPITHVTTKIKGTSGYMDYDYFLTRHLTRKSDVYAFGVVLFEVLCGRPALDLKLNAEQRFLAAWAQQCINEGTLDQIIDPTLTGQIFSGTLEVFTQIAVQSLHNLPTERPTMAEVVVSLERALTLQMRSDFSMLEEDFFNAGSAYNNQENENSYI